MASTQLILAYRGSSESHSGQRKQPSRAAGNKIALPSTRWSAGRPRLPSSGERSWATLAIIPRGHLSVHSPQTS